MNQAEDKMSWYLKRPLCMCVFI